jgi:hypothetical protein
MTTCPTCGHKTRTPRAATPVDIETMTDPQRFAHFKATAPREDLLFVARVVPSLAADVAAILDRKRKPTRDDAMRMFDRARHALTPQPVIDEAAFWRYHRKKKPELAVAA